MARGRRWPGRRLAACIAAALVSGAVEAQEMVPIRLSPALPAAGNPLQISVDAVSGKLLTAGPVEVQNGRILVDLEPAAAATPPAGEQTVSFYLAGLSPPGNYTVAATVGGAPYATLEFTLRPRTALLELIGARFQVAVDRQLPGAAATAVRLSDASGYFWFYDPTNPELTVKIVDGRAVNGHFWIFIASMTDVQQTVSVTDLAGDCQRALSCPVRIYANPPHTNQNFIDTGAF